MVAAPRASWLTWFLFTNVLRTQFLAFLRPAKICRLCLVTLLGPRIFDIITREQSIPRICLLVVVGKAYQVYDVQTMQWMDICLRCCEHIYMLLQFCSSRGVTQEMKRGCVCCGYMWRIRIE